jgi:O-methyltransferase
MKRIIQKIIKIFGFRLTRVSRQEINYQEIYQKYKNYTMIPSLSYIENLKICEKNKFLAGDVVECGTWKGGMIAGIADILGGKDRTYYLFDSFEGLPLAKNIDGEAALTWQNNTDSIGYYDNCKADINDALEVMNLAKIKNPQIIKGWFSETLPMFRTNNKIAFLRLDGDWYESILESLENLFPQVVTNGLIIIDDYYVWEGTSRAVHFYLNNINSKSKIFTLCDGIAYIVKLD